eukprot:GABV01002998.1.p1 GENE.GABV01002998.1~~GABV01002998.1.p1  ORF type:complete len:206 (-),score=89.08 GABV01002998.1:5-601(-)
MPADATESSHQPSEPSLSEDNIAALHNLAAQGRMYKLRLISADGEAVPADRVPMTSVPACMVVADGFAHEDIQFSTANDGQKQQIVALSIRMPQMSAAVAEFCQNQNKNTQIAIQEDLQEFALPHRGFLVSTRAGSFVKHIDIVKKQEEEKKAAEQNQSFFQKYWHYILIFVLVMAVQGVAAPPEGGQQGGGQGGGSG